MTVPCAAEEREKTLLIQNPESGRQEGKDQFGREGGRGKRKDSSLALSSRAQELCFAANLHLSPLPFHTPLCSKWSCALFIFAGLIYKEMAHRSGNLFVQAIGEDFRA